MTGSGYLELVRLTAPEIVVALGGLLVLVLDLSFLRRAPLGRRFQAAVIAGCLACAIAGFAIEKFAAQGAMPAGMLVVNPLTQLVQMALLALAIFVLILADSVRFTDHVGEYCALLLFSTTAMMVLVTTQNLLVLFLAIEFVSLSLYLLTGFDKESARSAEAALTYFLYGGMSAGMLLFGMSLLYGFSGSLALSGIAAAASQSPGDPMLTVAMVLVMAGFGFKVAAAPFHMWAPEVYQGAPSASAALIASSSKIAGFFALFLFFALGLRPAASPGWVPLAATLAAVSMLWGNLAAIAQTSVRRLLAYSAIGHAGYMLIALAAHTQQSLTALVYYVITYGLATAGAFGVLTALDAQSIDSIADFRGLGKRAPGLSFCLAVFLLSLAGIPPLAGFLAKFYLFTSALDGGFGLLWLVLLALAMSVVSFYYYLRVLKQVYVAEAPLATVIRVPVTMRLAVWAAAGVVLLLGCWPDLLLNRIAPGVVAAFR